MSRKILGFITPQKTAVAKDCTYVRAWYTGRIVCCKNIPNQPKNFIFFGYPVTQSLDILNRYWEIIPESDVHYIGYPQTDKERNQHSSHAFFNYGDRVQYNSLEEFLNR